LTDSNSNKTKKKASKRKKQVKTTPKQFFSFFLKILGILLVLFCIGILILHPTRDYLLSRIINNALSNNLETNIYFEHSNLNFWDFSLIFQNLHIKNPEGFPEESLIQSSLVQVKSSISPTFNLCYKLYFRDLTFNLYYIPGKGTNIGTLFNIFQEQAQNKKNSFLLRTDSIKIDKVNIIITQNLEPQKFEISKSNIFTSQGKTGFDTFNGIDILKQIITTYIIDNTNIPEDFRKSLINDIKQNTI